MIQLMLFTFFKSYCKIKPLCGLDNSKSKNLPHHSSYICSDFVKNFLIFITDSCNGSEKMFICIKFNTQIQNTIEIQK